MSKQKNKKTVDNAIYWLRKQGSISGAEWAMRKFNKCNEWEAQDLVQDAAVHLVAGAPREIRHSLEMVVAWHRWNTLYSDCERALDRKGMMEAQKHMDSLLKGVH